MKALTIKQPWAHLIAIGIKTVENRSWSTDYRGPLAIHAGARVDNEGMKRWGFKHLPLRRIVATAELLDIQQVLRPNGPEGVLLLNGEVISGRDLWCAPWEAGSYAWRLGNIRVVENGPVMSGSLKLWDWNSRQ